MKALFGNLFGSKSPPKKELYNFTRGEKVICTLSGRPYSQKKGVIMDEITPDYYTVLWEDQTRGNVKAKYLLPRDSPGFILGEDVFSLTNGKSGKVEALDSTNVLVRWVDGYTSWVTSDSLEKGYKKPGLPPGATFELTCALSRAHISHVGQEVRIVSSAADIYTVQTKRGLHLYGITPAQLGPVSKKKESSIEEGLMKITDTQHDRYGQTGQIFNVADVPNQNMRHYQLLFLDGSKRVLREDQLVRVQEGSVQHEEKPKLVWNDLTQDQRAAFVKKVVESMYMDTELCPKINSLLQ